MKHSKVNVNDLRAVDRGSSPLGPRLHLARRKAGLSLRKVAELIGAAHETVRLMEVGRKYPDEATLNALCQALGVSREYLVDPHPVGLRLGEIEFRKKARTSSADRSAIAGELVEILERYLEIEDIMQVDKQWTRPTLQAQSPNNTHAYAEEMALALREHWNLGLDPIIDLTKLLEKHGLKVIVQHVSEDISGMTCEVHREGRSSVFAILVNNNHSLERRRFTMAHELAHQLLDFTGVNGKMAESLCNTFAGAFLVPAESLREEMGPHPHHPTFEEIIMMKHFFRVSAAMLVMRLEQTGCIELWQRDKVFQTFGQTWRTAEPEPLERPSLNQELPRFRALVYQALACDFISVERAAEVLQVTVPEVHRGLRGPIYGDG